MHGMIHGTWRIHNHINYIIWYVSNGSSSRLSGMHSCFLLIFEMLWIPGQPNIQVKKSSDPGDLINLCLLTCIQLRCNLRINNQEALDHWMSTFGPRDLSYRFCLGWVGWVGWPFVRSMVNCQVGLSPRAKKTWHQRQRGPGVPAKRVTNFSNSDLWPTWVAAPLNGPWFKWSGTSKHVR